MNKDAKQELWQAISEDADRMAVAHRWFQTYGNILGFDADRLREAPLRSEIDMTQNREAAEEEAITAKLRGDS